MSEMTIRPAKPDDWQQAVPLIYTAGPEAFDYAFTQPGFCMVQDYLRRAFQGERGQFSYRYHWVLLHNGELMGTMLNYDLQSIQELHWPTVRSVLGYYRWRSLKVAKRGAVIEKIMPPPADGVLMVANLAISGQAQGLGLGSKLIAHAENRARQMGKRGLALDVSVENPSAQKLYERLGFKVLDENPSPTELVPGHRYMELVF